MQSINLLMLRQELNDKNILLCFNGPISSGLIQELGDALKNHLQTESTEPSLAMDVFGVFIELTQNIRHYAGRLGYSDAVSSATVVVAQHSNGYQVMAGNIVEPEDGQKLVQRINDLADMDKAALKAAFKKQLREPRAEDSASGAGLGLIDISRKSSVPLSCSLTDAGQGKAFLSILATI
ncbi:MAG: biofilm regulation protein kinase SiaB [Methylophaga sp.]|nr:biofilm regulation protein kinase SiaB [Methylophaga sp.]